MPFFNTLRMRNLFLACILLITVTTQGQPSGLGFNYQAVARNPLGELLQNQNLNLRLRIRSNNPDGQVVYEETHQINTNEYGLFSIIIGNGNQVSQRSFEAIDWAANPYFVQVSINNEDLSVDRLEAVPYSKVATHMRIENLQNVSSNSPNNGQVLKWNGNTWQPANDNTGNISFTAGEGIQINNNQIINTRPDVEIKLSAGDGIEIEGDYPSFEISLEDDDNGNTVWSQRGNRIFYNDGNVGIGTNNPNTPLDVSGNVHIIGGENSYGNNGNDNTALKIESEDGGGLETMILDGNEIDCINDVLYIQGNSEETLVIGQGGGRVGVGNFVNPNDNPPEYTLHVLHRAGDIKYGLNIQNEEDLDNIWTLHNSASPGSPNFNQNLFFVNNGDIKSKINPSGNYSRVSDARLKTQIQPLQGVMDKLLNLTPARYYMNGSEEQEIGFMAQDVARYFPELVDYDRAHDLYMLNYDNFGVLAIQAIKEQQQLIEAQQKIILDQESRLERLEERINQLEEKH